jgi:hypothetical protein
MTNHEASRNPYHQSAGSPEVAVSVVAYVDILGYRAMAQQAEAGGDENGFLARLYDALDRGRRWLREDDLLGVPIGAKDRWALKAFTDNIVIAAPIGFDAESELGDAFFRLGAFQFEMATSGFFVRGAVAVGSSYVDDIAVFGSAFTEAYVGESQLAKHPRILLTASARRAIKKHLTYYARPGQAPQSRDIYCDADGQWFLNYLECTLWGEGDTDPDYYHLLLHKERIEERLSQFSSDPTIRNKYAWAARYHNYFCDQHPDYFANEHRIAIDEDGARISRIAGD